MHILLNGYANSITCHENSPAVDEPPTLSYSTVNASDAKLLRYTGQGTEKSEPVHAHPFNITIALSGFIAIGNLIGYTDDLLVHPL